MGFKYTLRLPDRDDAGEAEFGYQPQAGDELRIDGNQLVRVLAVIPVELAAEFVDDADYGTLEIEPVRGVRQARVGLSGRAAERHREDAARARTPIFIGAVPSRL